MRHQISTWAYSCEEPLELVLAAVARCPRCAPSLGPSHGVAPTGAGRHPALWADSCNAQRDHNTPRSATGSLVPRLAHGPAALPRARVYGRQREFNEGGTCVP